MAELHRHRQFSLGAEGVQSRQRERAYNGKNQILMLRGDPTSPAVLSSIQVASCRR